MTTDAKLTIDVTGEPQVRALVEENERLRNTVNAIFEDLMRAGERLHVSKMRCLHALDPEKHGPVPENPLLPLAMADLKHECRRFREALERLADGDTCDTASYADCCDRACVRIAREALAPTQPSSTESKP